VIRVPAGRRAGHAVVLDAGVSPRDDPRPLVVTEGRWGGRLTTLDFPVLAEVLATVRVPKSTNYRSPQDRRDLAARLRALDLPEPDRRRGHGKSDPDAAAEAELGELRSRLRAHPCHGCADRELHARIGERYMRLAKEIDGLRQRSEGRTTSLARTFDRICALLDGRGYLAGDETTPPGRQLARIWSEADLVVAECLRDGAWDGLGPAELAAVASTMVYEPRRDERAPDRMPSDAVRDALATTARVWADVVDDETSRGLPLSREPQLGFVWPAFRWARGDSLDRVLTAGVEAGLELTAGDFVRWCKQVLDLLEQVALMPSPDGDVPPVARTARAAAAAFRRGVVAQSMQA